MKTLLLALIGFLVLASFLQVHRPALKETTTSTIPNSVISQFNAWKAQNNKHYGSAEADELRLNIFYSNQLLIEETNSQQSSYTLGETQFMDLTSEEFVSTYLGFIAESTTQAEDISVPVNGAFNWADEDNIVTPIKDQGQCGSCWAFSTTGVTEGAYALKNGKQISLSEQQLVDCATIAYGNLGCNGGNPYNAAAYVLNKGLTTEAAYGYTARQGTCKTQGGSYKIASRKLTKGCAALTADINTQPTSVAVDATNWSLYKSGIFSNCAANLNHAVLATGYDANGNWIVKNSWGTSWGVDGYITVKSGNTCGICNELTNVSF